MAGSFGATCSQDTSPSPLSGKAWKAKAKAQGMPQHLETTARRRYELAYILTIFLAFPLYWTKVMDSRLCGADARVSEDPWLMTPPAPGWAASWPCEGGQTTKMRFLLSSPMPFLRSLVWPICWSELHFTSSMYLIVLGGLAMWFLTPCAEYQVDSPRRTTWALVSRVQLKAGQILIKLLRPNTPWALIIGDTLPMEPMAALFFSVALKLPVRVQAVGAVAELILLAVICALYGKDWPYDITPAALVFRQAACGVVCVGASSVMCHGLPGGNGPGRNLAHAVSRWFPVRAPRGGRPCGKAVSPPPAPHHPVQKTADDPAGTAPLPEVRSSTPTHHHRHADDSAVPPVTPPVGRSQAAAVAAASPVGVTGKAPNAPLPPSSCPAQDLRRRVKLCQKLACDRSQDAALSGSSPDPAAACCLAGQNELSEFMPAVEADAEAAAQSRLSVCGGSSISGSRGVAYPGAVSVTHLYLKLQGVNLGNLAPGVQHRVGRAVGARGRDAVGTDVAVRAGCVEVHLDLVKEAAAAGVANRGISGIGGSGSGGGGGAGSAPSEPFDAPTPASNDQQGLASCILQALGLPPGYDNAVSAQIGTHLLTLTPAAAPAEASSGEWAVLGTRRMQALEVPWVTRVEPPAVVTEPCGGRGNEAADAGGEPCACACVPAAHNAAAAVAGAGAVAAGASGDVQLSGGHAAAAGGPAGAEDPRRHLAVVRMIVSGSAERLAVAHEDADLEILALFEGEFLPVANLQWEPLESPFGAAAGCGGGATGVRLPPSLTVCQRPVIATLSLPRGRSGAVNVILMRRGTAGQAHTLLLLRRQDAAVAAEVALLQVRAHKADIRAARGPSGVGVGGELGPPVSSLDRFVADLGRWLQYRDFWLAEAEAAAETNFAASSATAAAAAAAPAAAISGKVSSSCGTTHAAAAFLMFSRVGSWKEALKECFWQYSGGAMSMAIGGSSKSKAEVRAAAAAAPRADRFSGGGRVIPGARDQADGVAVVGDTDRDMSPASSPRHTSGPSAASTGVRLHRRGVHGLPGHANGLGNSNGHAGPHVASHNPHQLDLATSQPPTYPGCPLAFPGPSPALPGPHQQQQHQQQQQPCPHSSSYPQHQLLRGGSSEEYQLLAQRSLPAFGQPAYQAHMGTARRVLVEFALEQRCVAVARALLAPTPLPRCSSNGPIQKTHAAAAAAIGGSAGAAAAAAANMTFLPDLAEASRAASPDGLTLLHRAVRSGDAATVGVVLASGAAVAATAAAATATTKGLSPPVIRDASEPGCAGQEQAPPNGLVAAAPAAACPLRPYAWDTPDAHGLTPLHYLAVLDDGGDLAHHVLSTQADALALWDRELCDMPSAASFTTQNSWSVDVEALRQERRRREEEREQEREQERGQHGEESPAGCRQLVLSALRGFPSHNVESSYQRFASARSEGLPGWLLAMHLVACSAGLAQALPQHHTRCRRATLPIVVLHAASFLLALRCTRHRCSAWSRTCRTIMWSLQALALAALVAWSVVGPPRDGPMGHHDASLSQLPADTVTGTWRCEGLSSGDIITSANGGRDDVEMCQQRQASVVDTDDRPSTLCGGSTLHNGILVMYHALAVATLPYPHALLKVLAVQAVEMAACVLLGCMALGRGGAAVVVAMAGQLVRGSLLRGVTASLFILAAELRARALFVKTHWQPAQRIKAN